MSVLDSYMKDLAELVNKDRGTANIAGVTEAAKIMVRMPATVCSLRTSPTLTTMTFSSMLTSTPFSLTELLLLVL